MNYIYMDVMYYDKGDVSWKCGERITTASIRR